MCSYSFYILMKITCNAEQTRCHERSHESLDKTHLFSCVNVAFILLLMAEME